MGNPVRDEDARVTDSGERGLSSSRSAQLRRDMELTPEDRVRAAEETLKLDRLRIGIIVHPCLERAMGRSREGSVKSNVTSNSYSFPATMFAWRATSCQ